MTYEKFQYYGVEIVAWSLLVAAVVAAWAIVYALVRWVLA